MTGFFERLVPKVRYLQSANRVLIASGWALPRVRRAGAHRGAVPLRDLAVTARPTRCGDLVLERLSGHEPAPESGWCHDRDRRPDGDGRRRDAQYRRDQ